jgi:cyclic-di-GMP-binding protein
MPSFDIVSKVQWNEVDNALLQAQKELAQRYDFKDTGTELEKTADGLVLRSSSEDRLKAATTVLHDKLVKRKVSLKFLDPQKMEEAGKNVRQLIKIKEGIDIDNAKEIVRRIKDSKLKVQASIQEMQVRVSGKNKDDLQAVIQLVRAAGLNVELSFINFRD